VTRIICTWSFGIDFFQKNSAYNALLPSELMPDIRFPSVTIVTGEWALVHYDLFAISRVLPTVPKIRLSCILCTLELGDVHCIIGCFYSSRINPLFEPAIFRYLPFYSVD
jgi:hypothetical protein